MLEMFNNLFMSIAEQMGVALQNTAYSVNIKERLDFSCAVFDGDGSLVANAPHMPVHLGSMDRAVETIIRDNAGKIRAGRRLSRSTRPITAARICPTSPSARRCSTRRARRSCSGSPRAAITPTSAASRPARCRRTRPRSSRKASISTISSWSSAAGSARRSSYALLTGGQLSGAQSAAERQRPQGADRRQREGRARIAQAWSRSSRSPVVARLYGPRAGQRRRERAPRHRPAARQRIRGRDRSGRGHQGADHGRQAAARGDGRFHRHQRRSSRTISTRPSR